MPLAKDDAEDGLVDGTCLLVTGCEGPVKAGLLGTQERPPGRYN